MNYNEFAEKIKQKDSRFEGMDNLSVAKQVIKENPYYDGKVEFDDVKIQEETPQEKSTLTGKRRLLANGLLPGAEPILEGVGGVIGNTIANIKYNKPTFEDIKKSYLSARNEAKQDIEKERKINPLGSAGLEILGGLPTGAGILKGISIASKLKNPFARLVVGGGLAGGIYGANEGASAEANKVISPKNMLKSGTINSLLGAGLGGGLYGAGKVAQPVLRGTYNLLKWWGRSDFLDRIADKIKLIDYAKNPLLELKQPQFKNIIDVSAIESNSQSPKTNVAKILLPKTQQAEIINNKIPKYIEDDVMLYGKPDGTQNKTMRYFANTPLLQKEALKGNVGINFEKYGKEAVEELGKIKPIIKEAENNAYKQAGINDNYFVDTTKSDVINRIKLARDIYNDEVGTFAEITKADVELANKYTEILEKELVSKGGLSFGQLKSLTKKINKSMEQVKRDIAKGKNSSEYQFLKETASALSDLKLNDPMLSAPTKQFRELENAIRDFEDITGIDLDKPKGFASKIFGGARDRADGGIQEQALENFTKVMDKFNDTKALKDISDKIKMAQFAYDIRSTMKDSKFTRDVANPIAKIKNVALDKVVGEELEPQEFYQILAERLMKGEITPQQVKGKFRKIKIKGLNDTTANSLLARYILLGNRAGIAPSLLKDFIKFK